MKSHSIKFYLFFFLSIIYLASCASNPSAEQDAVVSSKTTNSPAMRVEANKVDYRKVIGKTGILNFLNFREAREIKQRNGRVQSVTIVLEPRDQGQRKRGALGEKKDVVQLNRMIAGVVSEATHLPNDDIFTIIKLGLSCELRLMHKNGMPQSEEPCDLGTPITIEPQPILIQNLGKVVTCWFKGDKTKRCLANDGKTVITKQMLEEFCLSDYFKNIFKTDSCVVNQAGTHQYRITEIINRGLITEKFCENLSIDVKVLPIGISETVSNLRLSGNYLAKNIPSCQSVRFPLPLQNKNYLTKLREEEEKLDKAFEFFVNRKSGV